MATTRYNHRSAGTTKQHQVTPDNSFNEVVSSYREAARLLDVEKYLHIVIRWVALRPKYQHRCPTCKHGRARHDVVERAMAKSALPTYERRCIYHHVVDTPWCKHWEPLLEEDLEPAA